MKGNFRTLLRKFCLESTILGLKYFYLYPDFTSRCFWLANMVAVLYLACLLSWLLYSRFAEMPTRVTIENQYEPVQDLPFPAITLCSPNQITISFMRHFNRTLVDGDLSIDLERVLPKLIGFYEYVNGVNASDMAHLQSLLDLNRYTVPEVMAGVAQSCDDFLKKCFFDGRVEKCNTLFQPLLTPHGLCCVFNSIYHFSNKRNTRNPHVVLRNVTQGGFRHGLIVVTDYNPEDAMDWTILDAGAAKVMFTDYTEFPTDDESGLVESNIEIYHAIRATHTYCSEDVNALPAWSRKCYMEDEHDLPHFRRYRNSDCDSSCYAETVHRACHCTLNHLPRIMPGDGCNLTSMYCIMNVKAHLSEYLSPTQCNCPRDCESRQYKVDMIVGNLEAMPHMMFNPFAGIKFNHSTTIMNFYFPNSVYVKKKQETVMSLITLASNLGGVFGLCLGCSGISVIEIFFYVYVGIRNHIKELSARLRRAEKIKEFK